MSLLRTLLTWVRAVRSLMTRMLAISRLDRPSPSSARIWRSRGVSRAGPAGPHPQVLGETPRDLRVQVHLAADGRPDGGGDLGGLRILEQVSHGTVAQRRVDPLHLTEAGEDHHPAGREALDDLRGGVDPVHVRHDKVHQHDAGQRVARCQFGQPPQRLLAVGGFTDEGQIVDDLDVGGEAAADDRVVVDDEHAHRCVGHG